MPWSATMIIRVKMEIPVKTSLLILTFNMMKLSVKTYSIWCIKKRWAIFLCDSVIQKMMRITSHLRELFLTLTIKNTWCYVYITSTWGPFDDFCAIWRKSPVAWILGTHGWISNPDSILVALQLSVKRQS